MSTAARRHLHRTEAGDLAVAAKIEKPVLHTAIIRSIGVELDFQQQLVYAMAAFVQDMAVANGEPVAVYPSDIAGLIGYSESRAGGRLAELKRAGLLAGSAAAGYRLAEPK